MEYDRLYNFNSQQYAFHMLAVIDIPFCMLASCLSTGPYSEGIVVYWLIKSHFYETLKLANPTDVLFSLQNQI